MSKGTEFMDKFVALMDEYDVELTYTIDDDGIHVIVEGNKIYNSHDLRDWSK